MPIEMSTFRPIKHSVPLILIIILMVHVKYEKNLLPKRKYIVKTAILRV